MNRRLDGADERQAQRRGIGGDSLGLERDALAYEAEVERKQQAWLAHPPK